MTATNISLIVAAFVGAFGSLAGCYQWYIKRNDETTKQREDREAQDRQSDLDRLDARTERIIQRLEANQARLEKRIEGLEERLTAAQVRETEIRAGLAQANITIQGLTSDNARLVARVKELEKHESVAGRPGAPGRDGRDGLLVKDGREGGQE